MKFVVILGDGMADLPLAALQGKTPLAIGEQVQYGQASRGWAETDWH